MSLFSSIFSKGHHLNVVGEGSRAQRIVEVLTELLEFEDVYLSSRESKATHVIYESDDIPMDSLPFEGMHAVPFVTSPTLWKLNTLPKTLLIIGSGPLTEEFVRAFSKQGTRVAWLATGFEPTKTFTENFKNVDIYPLAGVKGFERTVKGNLCIADSKKRDVYIEFDLVFLV